VPNGRLPAATDCSIGHPRVILARPAAAWRALVVLALLSLALVAVRYHWQGSSRSGAPANARPHAVLEPSASPLLGLSSLPAAARGPVSAALGADNPAYRVSHSPAGLAAANPAQRLRAVFGRSRVTLRSGVVAESLSLRSIGYGASLGAVGALGRAARANRVTYTARGLSEWYVNGPLGLEQGFTLARAPTRETAQPLTLSIALSGDARAAITPGGGSVTVSRGASSLRYGGLVATDARGHTLRSWLELRAGNLLLRVDARGARYPLRIDPLIQQARLEGTGEVGGGHFGRGVALSADGSTALIGAPRDEGQVGAAWVFTHSGSTWTQQAEIEGVHEAGDHYFGRSVSLSGDGDTALIGDPGGHGQTGVAWVFTRSGSTWTRRAKLEGGGEIGLGQFGARVALSADGATALIGGFADNGGAGAAWVFTLSDSTWTQQAKLEGGGEVGTGEFGRSVALSADGTTALIGGLSDDGETGAAWAFGLSGSTWTQQDELKAAGEIGRGEFGSSVALSASGDTALIGASQDDDAVGSAWVFTRSGSSWSQDARLAGDEEVGEGEFGTSVALSSDGDTALVGAPQDAGVGAAWLFAAPTWLAQGPKLSAEDEAGEGAFGFSVALSAEAGNALIGGISDAGDVGAAWVFAAEAPTVSGVAPGEGPATGGTPVIVTGTGFTASSTVSFGSVMAAAADVDVLSPTEISVLSPAGAGTVDVTVSGLGGTSATSPADLFSYVPAPTVRAVAPHEGPVLGGTPVTITGTGFTASSTVRFGSLVAVEAEVLSPTRIGVVAPAGSEVGAVDVTVSGVGGTSATSPADRFSYVPAPTVSGVQPGEGPLAGGTPVTVTGSGFAAGSTVRFGSVAVAGADVDVRSPTEISVVSRAGSEVGTVDVTVSGVGGTSATSPADRFSYVPAPTVSGVQPGEGPVAGGTPVTITGTGFTASSTVRFGSVAAGEVEVRSPTEISVVSPTVAEAGRVHVTVSSVGGTSATSPADRFTYASTELLTGGAAPGGAGTAGSGLLSFVAVMAPATLAVSGNVAPVSGTVLIRLPGGSSFVLLSSLRLVPFGTVIDATHGRVTVTTAGPHGGTQTGEFFDGEFILTQGREGLVVATLAGGRFAVCPTARERGHLARASASHATGKHAVRKLWANAHGSFSTKGNYAAGAVQGTEWLTEDLCAGTLIKVTRDKVKVTNLVNHRSTIVRVGHSLLVRAP
jgi:IPT/TIG domain/FG-GAP repeat